MKLLYISGTYCPAIGGAELSAHTLLKYLIKNHNVEVLVLTDKKYSGSKYGYYNYDSVNIYGIEHKNRENEILNIIESYSPDFIFTQLMWSDIALKIAKQKNIKSVLRVCKIPFYLDISINSKYSPNMIIGISEAVKKYVFKKWKRKCLLSPSAIDFETVNAKIQNPFSNKYILMFNPLVRKGGNIFKEISRKFPDKKFAVVPGWDILKNKKGDFDPKLIKNICDSLNVKYKNQIPETTSFDGCKNVSVLKSSNDVRDIFKEVKILCVPSQWEEALGRVALEGFANGIPVIGSSVGGLKDQIKKGGYLIEDYSNIDDWIIPIKEFDNEIIYEKYAKKGKKYIEIEYNLNKIVKEFYDYLKNFNS